jgi:2-methylfumaryl-CoA hydratase
MRQPELSQAKLATTKTTDGNFFENFFVGQVLHHATPRTISTGDVALYTSLYGGRFAVQSSDPFAVALGYSKAPVDDVLVFHIVFGKTVPDISLNAVANLGYAECRFERAVYPGDTLTTTSEVIGLRENSNGETGTVYVRSTGRNQRDETVVSYVRWVMLRKRSVSTPAPTAVVPKLAERIDPALLGSAVPVGSMITYNRALAGAPHVWGDYNVGERIDHVDGMTVEEAEHQIATRLYQNTAKVHFDQHAAKANRFGRRLIYGGVVISLARSLSFNGLANAFHVAGINAGRHVAPLFAGDTVYAWSEILERAECPNRSDIGLLRTRLIATKNQPCVDFPGIVGKDHHENVVLNLDLWLAIPR